MYKTKCLQSFEICDTDIVILVEKTVKVLGAVISFQIGYWNKEFWMLLTFQDMNMISFEESR